MSAGTGGRQGTSATNLAAPGRSAWGYYMGAGLALVMGLIFLNDFRYALAAQKTWAPAAGRVTESKVIRYRSRRSSSYSTFISYAYGAYDTRYSSGLLELNKYKLYFGEGSAQADLQDHFPVGKNIDVYYNPSHPSESSLGLAGVPGLAIPIIFFLLAAGAVYLARQE